MKKFITLFLFLLVALTSCAEDEPRETLDLTNKWTESVEGKTYSDLSLTELKNLNNLVANGNTIFNSYYIDYGLVILKNDNNDDVYFYSLLADEIISPYNLYRYIDFSFIDDVTIEITPDEYSGFTVNVYYNNYSFLSDANGLIIAGENISDIKVEYPIFPNSNYLDVYYTLNNDDEISLEHLKLTYENNIITNKEEISIDYNTTSNLTSLAMFGLEEYYISLNYDSSYAIIYDKNMTEVSSYYVPDILSETLNITKYYIKGGIYFEEKYLLPDDSTNYDYYDGTNKYGLNTYKFDFLSGQLNELNNKFIIYDMTSNSDFTSFKATIRKIRDDLSLEYTKTVLLNEDMSIYKEISDYDLNFITLKNGNYFNLNNKILFDKNMNILADLGNYFTTYTYNYDAIIISANNLSGVVSNEGKMLIPLGEGEILPSEYNNSQFFRITENSIEIIDLDNNNINVTDYDLNVSNSEFINNNFVIKIDKNTSYSDITIYTNLGNEYQLTNFSINDVITNFGVILDINRQNSINYIIYLEGYNDSYYYLLTINN